MALISQWLWGQHCLSILRTQIFPAFLEPIEYIHIDIGLFNRRISLNSRGDKLRMLEECSISPLPIIFLMAAGVKGLIWNLLELTFVFLMFPNPKQGHCVIFKYSECLIPRVICTDQMRSSWSTHLKCKEGWKGLFRQKPNALRAACFTGLGNSS